MKQVVFYALVTGLALSAGCTKETGETKPATLEKAVEQTQEAAVKATEKAEEITKQAKAAVSSLSVKAEDVMDDLNQSVADIKKKVAGFNKSQVLAYADTYKDVILEKKDRLTGMGEKIKGLSMTEMLGEKGKALKNQLAQYTEQLAGLKDRYGVYLDKLKDFGVDLSAYGL